MLGPGIRIFAIAVLAALIGILVGTAVVLLAGDDDNAPIQILLPTPDAARDSQATANGPAAGQSSVEGELKVYITGAVRNPGVYHLLAGDRVEDAVAAAGGAIAEADLEAVNLARRVQDEAYYHVPRVGETPRPPVEAATAPDQSGIAGSGSGKGLIDLNTASAELLETLPGIGQVRAQAILEYRKRNGPFRSVEQVTGVEGIGPNTYQQIQDLVTVGKLP